MNDTMSVGDRVAMIFAEAKRIAGSATGWAIGYVVGVTAIATFIDIQGLDTGGDFIINVVSFIAGFFMTKAFLENSGLAENGLRGGIGIYFGLALVSGLGIILGLVLLILPGLYLITRWAPAYGFALVEDKGVTVALGDAWNATKGHEMPIAVAILLPIALIAAGVLTIAVGYGDGLTISLPMALLGNLLIFGSTVFSTVIGLAAYSLLSGPKETVEAVFD